MTEPYRPVAERCEILAVALHDRGDTQDAQLLWDADARIRELEAENARLCERLEDKTRSLRVEIAAKQGAHNEIRILEATLQRAVRRLDEGYDIRPESQAHYDMQDALPDTA